MIKQDMDRTRFPSRHHRTGSKALVIGLGLGLGLALGMMPGPRAEAAPLTTSAATNAPLKYPTYLDHEGLILSNSAATHALSARDRARAAYVAYKLQDGAQVSKAIPLMKTNAPLPQAARQAMTTVASGHGKIAVRTQTGLYLLNAYKRGQRLGAQRLAAQRVSTSHIAVRSPQISAPQTITGSTPNSGTTGGTSTSTSTTPPPSVAPLIPPSGLLAGSPEIPLDPPKATPSETQTTTTPGTSLNLVLVPAGNVLEAPVPEPGTLAFAGLAIAGFAVRHGLKRRKAALA